ncbi:protein of unknown function [Nitrosotalea devaniterrae]|uniref:Uncharacterized protein n=1 Tax=Nitrosotalea devaniterrae TaxID=1078905 RepID=A0A128A3M6_9ARCH|nr:protein of unknown function [Candidatus Nitrosotalea devanaterra]
MVSSMHVTLVSLLKKMSSASFGFKKSVPQGIGIASLHNLVKPVSFDSICDIIIS